MKNQRTPEYPVHKQFVKRWSPRALSGEPVTKEQLMTLFEAAKWAPSSYNNQPWRFVYAMRDTPAWSTFMNLLGQFNQQWCQNGAALVLVCAKKNFEHNNKPSRTHEFDTGAAWMSLALQGSLSKLVVHGMEGFDYDRARTELGIPDDCDIECMVAIGKKGKKSRLPKELRKNEFPNQRKKVSEIVFEGRYRE